MKNLAFAFICLASIWFGACKNAEGVDGVGEEAWGVIRQAVQCKLGDPRIKLKWKTESESNSFGYFIYRADTKDGEYTAINAKTPLIGAGTSTVAHAYVYYDLDVENDTKYFYRIKQVDLDGTEEWIVGKTEGVGAMPKPLSPEDREYISEHGISYSSAVSQ